MAEELQALVKGWVYRRGRTLKWLAEEVGIDPSSLTRALQGEFGSKRLMLAISAALQLSAEESQLLLETAGYGEAQLPSLAQPALRLPRLRPQPVSSIGQQIDQRITEAELSAEDAALLTPPLLALTDQLIALFKSASLRKQE
jgi:AraC-like DNA-binding protein